MKSHLSPGVIAAIIAVVVIVVGLVFWKANAGPPAPDASKIPAGMPGGPPAVPGQVPPGANPVTQQGAPNGQ